MGVIEGECSVRASLLLAEGWVRWSLKVSVVVNVNVKVSERVCSTAPVPGDHIKPNTHF